MPDIKYEIITRIKTACAIVHGGWELVRLYGKKVKKVIERCDGKAWEG